MAGIIRNKIKLIEIPYYNYEKLNWEFLKEMMEMKIIIINGYPL